MLFAVCADRGSPGSTTTALALAAARGLPAVVVEADPYGGDLALRVRPDGKHPLPSSPTVLGIGAGRSARKSGRQGPIGTPEQQPGTRHLDLGRDGSHQLSSLVRVVPGFLNAEKGTSLAWPVLAAALEAQTVPVFADLGRIHTGSPSIPIAAAADALITVCRGDMASVHHMTERLELLVTAIAETKRRPPVVLPVVVAARKHGDRLATAVSEVLANSAAAPAVRGVGWLAWDPSAVSQLEDGGDPWAKPMRNSPLMKSARKVMWRLCLATGLDHAEPEMERKRAGSQNQQSDQSDAWNPAGHQANATNQQPRPEQQSAPAAQVPPPSPRPTGPPPAGWTPSPRPSANGQRVSGRPSSTTGEASVDDARRWQIAPMGEEP